MLGHVSDIAKPVFRLIVFLTSLLAYQPSLLADDARVVKCYVTANFPPYYTLDEDGNLTGFGIEVMNAIAKRSGIQVHYTVKETWPEILQALKDGEADILASIGVTEERKAFANFTPPVEVVPVSIFIREEEPVSSEEIDLRGMTVAVVRNNVGHFLMRNNENISLVVYEDAINGLFGLLSGNVDAFVYPEPVTWQLARQAEVDDQIKTAGAPVAEIKRAIAVSKHLPELHRKLSESVTMFVGSPEYQAIYIRWFGQPTPFWTPEKLVIVLVVVVLVALFIIVAASYLWRINKILNEQIKRRLELEENLRSQYHIYETAINTPAIGFWAVGENGKLLKVNQAYVDMSGYSREELLSMSVPDVEALENPEDTAEHIAQLKKMGFGKFQSAHRRKDGTVYPVEVSTTYTPDQDGLFLAFVEDITERVLYEQGLETKLAERTKSLNEEIIVRKKGEIELLKLSRAVEQSAHIIFITDPDGVIEYINPKFTELLGYTQEEAIGQTPRLLKSEDTPKDRHKQLWATILSGKEWRGELKDRKKNGETFWASVAISPVRDDQDKLINFISVHEDITERKQAELATHEARRAAEVANKAKTDLLANMSHELRTPLNAIIGFSDAMIHGVLGDIANPKYLDYAVHINDSGDHLLKLINDILDVSAIEAGKLDLHEEAVSIDRVCKASFRIIAPKANEKKITLNGVQGQSLPKLYCDELRLKQIIINLLSNAVKFTPDNGVVSCDARIDDGGDFVITVTDNGVGMNESDLAKAFEKFSQADSTFSRTHEGTGLGLSLTKGLVELHDGTLELVSRLGSGTTVTIRFPAARVLH